MESLISKYIIDREINIPSNEWLTIISNHSKEDIIKSFTDEILVGSIRLPTRIIGYDQMKSDFKSLCEYESQPYLYSKKVFSRYEYRYPLSGWYIDEPNIGTLASDYFHQTSRYHCDSINEPSPVRVWNSEKFLHSALGALFTLKQTQVNTQTLRTCLSLRKYIASQFKPAVAKSLYEKYNANNVLDFSAGWGDRLCGFYAAKCTVSYTGVDPNTNLFNGYIEQSKQYSELSGTSKKVCMYCSPAEDITYDNNSFDFVFTSPPYYNIEKYCQEETQSFKRYRKFDIWLSSFLFKAIDKAWQGLKSGGHIAINISDVYSGHKINNICDPMNDHIKELGGIYCQGLGMRMAKRPNSKAHKDGVFVEPIWIWRKS